MTSKTADKVLNVYQQCVINISIMALSNPFTMSTTYDTITG